MPAWVPHIDSSIVLDSLKSLLLLLTLLITRTLIVRSIARNSAMSMEAKRRWVVTTRNFILFALLIGLVVIWAHELQALTVSLVALAAALVLATKELILCLSGAALRVGGKVYSVGDRIQIAGHRGVVLDHDIFATKLLEIGPWPSVTSLYGSCNRVSEQFAVYESLIKENPGQAVWSLYPGDSAQGHGRLASC
jgi:Small-conductance mechanosensitive channel